MRCEINIANPNDGDEREIIIINEIGNGNMNGLVICKCLLTVVIEQRLFSELIRAKCIQV